MVRPAAAMQWLGYLSVNSAGRAEFFAIYGGLQLGLSAFFAICASSADHRSSGLMFAVLLYLGIVLLRLTAMWRAALQPYSTRMLLAGESLLLVGALVLLATTSD